ncbi:MAG: multidrug MFS transporter [Ruminococcaceae bacterium]|nr:multidrug MFS transporter [Oscillospiraceae bacterium]
MIFVTVGTHEQPFDRLLKYMDELAGSGALGEEVVMQTGYTDFQPRHCRWQKLYPFGEMNRLVDEARIVITHGGPSSFIMPLQRGRIPVVVPRREEFGEHVNDHQVDFCRQVAQRQSNIIVVEDIDRLGSVLTDYDRLAAGLNPDSGSNNERFCREFAAVVDSLFEDK